MGSRIYVGNLPFTADESQVRALFEPSGGVREVRIVEDRETGRPRGFAFVEMNSDAEAEAAIKAVHGLNFGGRSLTVNEARERENRGGGGGFGGGGGGGGYGGGGGGYGGGGGGYGGGGGGGGRGGPRGGGGGRRG
jgi:RNA recognition motif-containing protein